MQIALLGHRGSWYIGDLQRAARERGHDCQCVEFPRLVGRAGGPLPVLSSGAEDLTRFGAVVVRTMPAGSLEQVVFRMDALARLQAGGVCVLNPPKAIECAVDKFLATVRLEAAGLAVPPTITCEGAEDALTAFQQLGGDVVLKPLFGSEGRGIVRVSDSELALRTFRTLERIQSVLYLQQFIEHEGFDLRVLVLDGHVLGAMRRHGRDDFRTNVSQRATAEAWRPSDEEMDRAIRAAAATGTRFAGVDLLTGRDGRRFVLEVNAVPGWRAFARVTGCDVAGHVVESLQRGG